MTVLDNLHFKIISEPLNDIQCSDIDHNVDLWRHNNGKNIKKISSQTSFGFVLKGPTTLLTEQGEFKLESGMFFSVPGSFSISGGQGFLINMLGYNGTFLIGGGIEKKGRLNYIDGCTDSLLIPPILKGNPCLNHLHFPPGISQTRHTHPSIRIGIVARGTGECRIPSKNNEEYTAIPLKTGDVFIIPTDGQHSFFTNDNTMDVVAYHPDSDIGPEHTDHPMVNRTIVDGISASEIEEIQSSVHFE